MSAVDLFYAFDSATVKAPQVTGELHAGGPSGALLTTAYARPGIGLVGPMWLRFTFKAVQSLTPGATYTFLAHAPSISPSASIDLPTWATCSDDYAGGTGYFMQRGVASDLGMDFAFRAIAAAPTISIGDTSILEGDTGTRILQFPVTLSQPAPTPTTVSYTVSGITATGAPAPGPNVDFNDMGAGSATLTFAAGSARALIAVTLFGDTTAEPDETLQVTLSTPSSGYDVGRDAAIGTVLNDDGVTSATTVGIGDAMVVRSRIRNTAIVFPVTLSRPLVSGVVVGWSVSAGSAHFGTTSTSDYGGLTSGEFTMGRGATQHNIMILPIRPDANPSAAAKTFTVRIIVTGSASTIRPTATGTIVPAPTGPNLPGLARNISAQIGPSCNAIDPINGSMPGTELDITWTAPTTGDLPTGFIVALNVSYPNEAPIAITLPTVPGNQSVSSQCFPIGTHVSFSVASSNDAGTDGRRLPERRRFH